MFWVKEISTNNTCNKWTMMKTQGLLEYSNPLVKCNNYYFCIDSWVPSCKSMTIISSMHDAHAWRINSNKWLLFAHLGRKILKYKRWFIYNDWWDILNDENLTSHVQQDEQCLDRLLDLYHIPICQIILLSKKTAIFVMVQKFLPVFKRMCLMVISPSRWDYTTFGLNAIVIFISIQHFLACIFDSSLYKDLAIQQSQHLFRLLMQIYGAWTNSHRLTILQNIVLALINVTQQSVWSDLFSIKNNLHMKSSSGY